MKATFPKNLPENFQDISYTNKLRSISIEKQIYSNESPPQRSRNKSIDYLSKKRKDNAKEKGNKDVTLVTYLACQNNRLLNYLELKNIENSELNANLEALSTEISGLTEEGQYMLSEDAKVVISQNETLRKLLTDKAKLISVLENEVSKKEEDLKKEENLSESINTQKANCLEAQREYSTLQEKLKILYSKASEFTSMSMSMNMSQSLKMKANPAFLNNSLNQANHRISQLEEAKKKLLEEAFALKEKLKEMPKPKTQNEILKDSTEMKISILEMKVLLRDMDEYIESQRKEDILNSLSKVNKEKLSLLVNSKN